MAKKRLRISSWSLGLLEIHVVDTLLIWQRWNARTTVIVCMCGYSSRAARRPSLGWKTWRSTCEATRGRSPTCVSTQDVRRPSATRATEPNTSEHTWKQWGSHATDTYNCRVKVHACERVFVESCNFSYVCGHTEAIYVPGARLREALHWSQLLEETREVPLY